MSNADEMIDRRSSYRWERHVGALLQVVTTAILLWTGNTLIDLREQVAVLKVQSDSMQAIIAQAGTQQYSISDANKDFSRIDGDIKKLDGRVSNIEDRMMKPRYLKDYK